MNPPSLTQGRIFRFWSPLAATWLMMAVEGPFLAAIVARLAEPKFNLAAYGVAFSFALLVEAPVIMLMSASTALVKDSFSLRRLRRFTWALNGAVTLVGLAIVLPPVFHLLAGRLIGLPPEVEKLSHGALILLLPWPAAIGYRRLNHGLLIRAGLTRRVTVNTVFRLVAMTTTALLLYRFSPQTPGALVAAAALSAGVISEGATSRLLAHGTIRTLLATPAAGERLSYGQISRFYAPLAMTSVLALGVQPIVVFFVGRSRLPIESLAVLPVVNALVFIFRAMGLAYQEVGIALLGEQLEGLRPLGRFALNLGLILSGALVLVAFTPLAGLWFRGVSGLTTELARFALTPTRLLVLIPGLTVLLCFQRALLVTRRATMPITYATLVEVAGVLLGLLICVNIFHMIGAVAAAIALVAGRAGSTAYLLRPCRRIVISRDPARGHTICL